MAGEIRLGTSSFYSRWLERVFYPKGPKSADYLGYYSRRFDTVEVDSPFYRCPTIEAVNNWRLKTPPGFIFSLKIPQTITHQKILVDCEKELCKVRGIETPLNVQLPVETEPTLFDISPN
jgi:uncharacterized protein YecE (DUF72 family)